MCQIINQDGKAVMKNEPEQNSEGDLDEHHLILMMIGCLPQFSFDQADFNEAYHQWPVTIFPTTFQDAYHNLDQDRNRSGTLQLIRVSGA